MKKYICEIKKHGEILKSFKFFIILFTFVVANDIMHFPSKIIDKYNMTFFFCVFIGAILIVCIFLIENHVPRILKSESANMLDALLLMSAVGEVIYLTLLFTINLFAWYKLIILLLCFVISTIMIKFRIYTITSKENVSEGNSNIIDLKDFISKNITANEDLPILFCENEVEYDLFDRSMVINQLYSSIMACRNNNKSFVIGLEGPWGIGKTTIINNVKKKFKEDNNSDFSLISDFDPWNYETQQALLISLFDKILNNVGVNYNLPALKKISDQLIQSILGESIASNIIGDLVLSNYSETDIQSLKEQVNTYLSRNGKHIVLFIDNLDRASAENIVFLLKIISNVLDLKGIIYVLSYDKMRMNEILSSTLNIDKHYIEKVVNQEIKVTKLNKDNLRKVIADCFEKLLSFYKIPADNHKDYDFIVDFLVSHAKEIREFKRTLNSVGYILSIDTNLYKPDLFALEIIRFLDDDLYESIKEHPQYYVSLDIYYDIEIYKLVSDRKKINSKGKEYFDSLYEKHNKEIIKLLSNVFPYVKNYINGKELKPEYDNEQTWSNSITVNCGAASAKYFESYFHYDENEYLKISSIYKALIDDINNAQKQGKPADIPAIFDMLFENLPTYYHLELVNKIWAGKDNIDRNLYLPIFYGLINIINKLDRGLMFLMLTAYERACSILAYLFVSLSMDEKKEILNYLKSKYNLLNSYPSIQYWIKSSISDEAKKEDYDMFDVLMKGMYNSIINKNLNIFSDENYSYRISSAFIRIKKKYLELPENVATDISENILNMMSPKNIYRILADIIYTSTGSLGHGYYIEEINFNQYFKDKSIVDKAIESNPPSNEIEDFICKVYEYFKSGEKNIYGDNALYVKSDMKLWTI